MPVSILSSYVAIMLSLALMLCLQWTVTVVGPALPNTTFMATVTITEFLYKNVHNSGHTIFINKSNKYAKNECMTT